MGNRVMWVVALIFGGILTAGTGGPGVVFLIFVFVIGMLNEWGRGNGRRERETQWKAEGINEKPFSPLLKAPLGRCLYMKSVSGRP